MSTNGLLSFQSSFTSFVPRVFPLSFSLPIIAPFWDDSDNRNGGQVLYRFTDEQSILDEIALNISSAFGVEFAPSTAFIATWNQLPQFSRPADVVRILTAKYNIVLHVCFECLKIKTRALIPFVRE